MKRIPITVIENFYVLSKNFFYIRRAHSFKHYELNLKNGLATRSIAERRTETTAETGSQTIRKAINLVKPTINTLDIIA